MKLIKTSFLITTFFHLNIFNPINVIASDFQKNILLDAQLKSMFFEDSQSKRRIEIKSKCFLPASDDFTIQDYDKEVHRKYFSQKEKGAEITFYENKKNVGTAVMSCAGLHGNGQGYMGLETYFEYGEMSAGTNEEVIFYNLTVAQEEMSPGSIDYRYLNFAITSEGKKLMKKGHFLEKWNGTFMNTSEVGITSSK